MLGPSAQSTRAAARGITRSFRWVSYLPPKYVSTARGPNTQHSSDRLRLGSHRHVPYRSYFTNGDQIRKNDPYQILGLSWGDGASTAEIRQAFREKARELHPDVNKDDTPEQALQKFQQLQKAYEQIMKSTTTSGTTNGVSADEWSVSIWRQGDRIAMDRTDVAGVSRKRPAQPVSSRNKNYGNLLGHPNGKGIVSTRGEYLTDGNSERTAKKKPSSVGRGLNKWVKPKEFKPWNPETASATGKE